MFKQTLSNITILKDTKNTKANMNIDIGVSRFKGSPHRGFLTFVFCFFAKNLVNVGTPSGTLSSEFSGEE